MRSPEHCKPRQHRASLHAPSLFPQCVRLLPTVCVASSQSVCGSVCGFFPQCVWLSVWLSVFFFPNPPPTVPPSGQQDEAEWEKETKKKIESAFKLFDKEKKGVVVQEEVPTIMRYLNVYPSEKMLVSNILPSMQGDEPTSFVTYAKLEEVMLELMFHKVCDPDPEDILLQAFKTLDVEGKGYIEWDKMREIMQGEGEAPFRDKEIEQFQRIAMDIDTGHCFYEDYVAALRNN